MAKYADQQEACASLGKGVVCPRFVAPDRATRSLGLGGLGEAGRVWSRAQVTHGVIGVFRVIVELCGTKGRGSADESGR